MFSFGTPWVFEFHFSLKSHLNWTLYIRLQVYFPIEFVAPGEMELVSLLMHFGPQHGIITMEYKDSFKSFRGILPNFI